MFELTESVSIQASPAAVWTVLADVERWWPPSNPEHVRIDVHAADKRIEVGTPVSFEERVAGIAGRAQGTITRCLPGIEVTWEGTARYRYAAVRFRVQEGVSWRIADAGGGSTLSAHVWAQFPPGFLGWLLEWTAKRLLRVVERDREHARTELAYLKETVEGAAS